jgi:hypothetical protein
VEERKEIHGQKPKGREGNLVFRLMGKELATVRPDVSCSVVYHLAYIASQQCLDLLLDILRMPQKPFLNRKTLELAFPIADVIDFRVGIGLGPRGKVIRICPDVSALSLHCALSA